MRKSFYTLIIFLSIVLNDYAQNLVPNSSFENFTSCPTAGSQILLAPPWQPQTTNSTDYYNACGSGGTNVPNGGGGNFQYPRTGVAYAGIWALQGTYHEYLQVQLGSALEMDSCYYIEYYCNTSNLSAYGINKMGAALSNTAISATGSGTGSELTFTPQIVSNEFLADTVNWMKVSGYYQANGGEQYLTIGNFSTYLTTDTTHIGGNPFGNSYYYIDDVTVVKVPNCDTTLGIDETAGSFPFSVSPNPNDGAMTFQYNVKYDDIAVVKLYDLAGKIIVETILDPTAKQLNIDSALDSGIYIYQVLVNGKLMKSDKIIIIE